MSHQKALSCDDQLSYSFIPSSFNENQLLHFFILEEPDSVVITYPYITKETKKFGELECNFSFLDGVTLLFCHIELLAFVIVCILIMR